MKIGILAHPFAGQLDKIQYPTRYVNWIRLSGAIPVVFSCYEPISLKEVDGLLLTGGDIELPKYTRRQYTIYLKSVQQCIRKAKQYNDRGVYFPIWGTCLGFELMIALETSNSISTLFDTMDVCDHYAEAALSFTSAPSRIKSYFTPTELARFKRVRCANHRHHYGFQRKFDFLNVVSLDHGYINLVEFKWYPFYGCQFHVEDPFNETSTLLSYQLSKFFKEECSKN